MYKKLLTLQSYKFGDTIITIITETTNCGVAKNKLRTKFMTNIRYNTRKKTYKIPKFIVKLVTQLRSITKIA